MRDGRVYTASMMKGRLGLETAGIVQSDRHGLLWLERGRLYVENGTLRFVTAGNDQNEALPAGDYAIPFQTLSCVLLQPGSSLTHDAARLLARHGTGLVFVGTGGVRLYASMPFGPNASARARRHVTLWADTTTRIEIARRMYRWRMGPDFPMIGDETIDVLRGMEGVRVKEAYARIASEHKVVWSGRHYNRNCPENSDTPNQAINHAATAVVSLAQVAVAVCGAIPQLGFIHEGSSISFALDIADLFRESVTLPVSFEAVATRRKETIDRCVRRIASSTFRRQRVIERMIDQIKDLLGTEESQPDIEAIDDISPQGESVGSDCDA
jgi:CRISP-associated protein Cas1